MIKSKAISHELTGQFSKLILDYLASDEKLRAFYSIEPNIESFESAIKTAYPLNRTTLTKTLEKQYKNVKTSSLVRSNIALLNNENTFTVCTGHQLCILGGPLYFIYKLISTINLAKKLKEKYPQKNFIPVYWLASEDHDYQEINHLYLFGKKIEWPANEQTNKPAVGTLNPSFVVPKLQEIKQILGESNATTELISLFESAYSSNTTLAEATREWVNELFGEYGLVVLDSNDADLKKEFIAEIHNDIFSNKNYKTVNETTEKLRSIGYNSQVSPREINFFYLTENSRERIEYNNTTNEYNILNTSLSFSQQALEQELSSHPERFSPNVVTRPLYQQKILPNIAYVGGPGELAYWLQYKSTFDNNKINYPALILRNTALLIDKATQDRLTKLNLQETELFEDTDLLIKKTILSASEKSLNFSQEENELKETFKHITEKLSQTDITLKTASEAELQKVLNGLKALEAKALRSEKQKQESTVNQLKKIKEKLFPSDGLQERHENFCSFYATQGNQFIADLIGCFDPFNKSFLILYLNDQKG